MPGHKRMREALAIAATEGAAEAARRTGVPASTIRSRIGRERTAKAKAAAAPVEARPPVPPPAPASETAGDGGPLDSMRRARDAHRRVEAQALAATERALADRDENGARAAATASGIASDKALALDRALVAAEAAEQSEAARLSAERIEQQRSLLARTFEAVGIPAPAATMAELARQAASGEPIEVPGEVLAADRERVRAAVRSEHLEQLLAEGWTPPGEAEEDDDSGEDGDEADEEGEQPVPEEAEDDMTAEQRAKLDELLAEHPTEPERAERRWRDWVAQEARRADEAQREAQDEALFEERGDYAERLLEFNVGIYRDPETARRETVRDLRGEQRWAGEGVSVAADIRARPAGAR